MGCCNTKLEEYTLEEISYHNHKDSLWIIVNDFVFDVTNYNRHPGGKNFFLQYGGKDVSKEFNEYALHRFRPITYMMDYALIGKVKPLKPIKKRRFL